MGNKRNRCKPIRNKREQKAFKRANLKKILLAKKLRIMHKTDATSTNVPTSPAATNIKIELEHLDIVEDVDIQVKLELLNEGSEDIKPSVAQVCADTSLPSDASDDAAVTSLPLLNNINPNIAPVNVVVSSPLVNVERDTKIDTVSPPEPWTVSKSLCRCCHAEGDFDSISSAHGDEPSHNDMLRNVFNIQLCPTAGPGSALRGICALCLARLNDANQFLQQVRACDQYFTRMYDAGLVKLDEGRNKSVAAGQTKAPKSKRPPDYRLLTSDYIHTGTALKCTRCDRAYNTPRGLRLHVKYKHLDLFQYKCPECPKQFRTFAPYTRHKLEAHGIDDRFKCNACPGVFNTRSQLVNHKNSFHMLGTKIRCDLCNYECFSMEALNKHKYKHKTVKDHHCKFCNKAFVRKTTLVLHERIHTGDRRKVCTECKQAFVQKASLNYHMAKYHPGVNY